MPIVGIISQPAVSSIKAAYNEILLRVTATNTAGTPIPPVVYCDVYFFETFYKTISKTQYNKLNATNSEWEFDIQDVVQEYLKKQIANNGESAMIEIPVVVARTTCKFRSSGINSEGFIATEGTAPIQGTNTKPPVSGTGTLSVVFYAVNAALQRDDNQSLPIHLNSFKNRTWDANTYPLTHRPDHYKICLGDSDSFPIISSKKPTRLTLHYQIKTSQNWFTIDYVIPCVPVGIGPDPFIMPDAQAGVVYNYSLLLTGTKPFSISSISFKPAWMSINIVDDKLVFSGLPTDADVSAGEGTLVYVANCTGVAPLGFNDNIAVLASVVCVPVSVGTPIIPDALANTPYVYDLPLTGTAPFELHPIQTKPSWMTITVVGSTIQFRGTPSLGDVGNDKPIKIKIINCASSAIPQFAQISEVIDVAATGRRVVVLNETANTIQLTNMNGTITILAGDHAEFNMPNGQFTVTTMVDADRTFTMASGLPLAANTVIDYLDVNQGDVISIPTTEFNQTRFIEIE